MKVGILLGVSDSSGIKSREKESDLQKFYLSDKFAMDLLNKFARRGGIEISMIRRTSSTDLSNKANDQKFDLLIALSCQKQDYLENGIKVAYNVNSRESRAIASLFQEELSFATGLKNLGTVPRNKDDGDGIIMHKLDTPCIIVDPFPIYTKDELQSIVNKYETILNSFISTIIKIDNQKMLR